MHDRIFKEQASITSENAKEKLREFANGVHEMDQTGYQRCMEDGMSVGLVLRDMQLAQAYEVSGTPTIFINGRRVEGVESAKKLRDLIGEARVEMLAGSTKPQAIQQ
jgi:protein-disulfide isomerase